MGLSGLTGSLVDIVVKVAVVLGLVYLGLMAAAYIFQRQVLYIPGSFLPAPQNVGLGDAVAISYPTADGLIVKSWYFAPKSGMPVILLFHGNAGTIADRAFKAVRFQAAGYGVLLAEYRGYGGNPGAPAEQGLYADGEAALGFLAHEGYGPERLVVYGESLGSGVAVELARRHRFAAVVLEAPFTSIPDVGQHHYWFLPVRLLIEDRFASIDKIDQIRAPLLIVHGEADTVVPVEHGRRLLARARQPKRAVFLEQARHNDIFTTGGDAAVLSFLAELFAADASQ